jgi:hypothetical protein
MIWNLKEQAVSFPVLIASSSPSFPSGIFLAHPEVPLQSLPATFQKLLTKHHSSASNSASGSVAVLARA